LSGAKAREVRGAMSRLKPRPIKLGVKLGVVRISAGMPTMGSQDAVIVRAWGAAVLRPYIKSTRRSMIAMGRKISGGGISRGRRERRRQGALKMVSRCLG
jgi:hypothetical protein